MIPNLKNLKIFVIIYIENEKGNKKEWVLLVSQLASKNLL